VLHVLRPLGNPPASDSTPALAVLGVSSNDARTRRGTVLAFVGRRSSVAEGETPHMSELTIDIQTQVDRLRSIKSDLEAYYWDQPADGDTPGGRRFQISFWIRQLADRTAALEALLMHQGDPQVVVPGVSPTEREALQSAAAVLDQWIHEDESFHDVQRVVGTILSAADRISLRAAGGVPRRAVVGPQAS
jgi:anthranilate phosphoribosyltransferase